MKKSLLLNALKIAFLAIFLPIFKLNAQHIQVTETRPSDMTVCMGDYTFSLKIKNITASPVTAVNIMLDLPDYISYTGNLTNALELSNDPGTPSFEVPLIPSNDSVTVTYSAAASCGIVGTIVNNQTIANNYGFTYIWSGTGYTLPGTNFQSYNLLYANLSITTSGTFPTMSIGDQADYFNGNPRSILVSNGGNGAIDTVIIRIVPEPEITYLGFFGSTSLLPIPFTNNGTEIILKIGGVDLVDCGINYGDPNLFEGGESFEIYENFIVDSCAIGNTNYRVAWGCDGEACNDVIGLGNGTTSANINVNPGTPQFDIYTGTQTGLLNYCGNDGTMEFFYVNTGADNGDFATNIHLDIMSYEENGGIYTLPQSFELFDYQINGISIDPGLIVPDNSFPWVAPLPTSSSPGYHIDLTQNTTSGMGLLDLDSDGFLDDLPAGDTIKLTIQVRFLNADELNDECPLRFEQQYGMSQIFWETSCGDELNSMDGATWHSNRYISWLYPDANTLVDPIAEPADLVENEPENFTFCTGTWYYQQSAFDCPVNEYQAVINLPNGYHLEGSTASWYSNDGGDNITYTAQEIGNQIIIDGGGTSNVPGYQNYWAGCFTVPIVLQCEGEGSIPSTSNISWEFKYKCADCDVWQRRACSSETVYNHVRDCPDTTGCKGILSTDFDVRRTTFGWTDASMTTHVDPSVNTNINVDAAYMYDEVQTTTSGEVFEIGMDGVQVVIQYSAPYALFDFTDATFEIYNSGGVLVNSCLAAAPTITGTMEYKFDMPCFGLLSVGDSVVLKANWRVANTVSSTYTRIFNIQDFRSYYETEFNDTIYDCESWGDHFTIYNNESFPHPSLGTNPNGCGNLTINLVWVNWGGTTYNDFPYEFRPIGMLDDTMKFSIPEGYEYAGNAVMNTWTSNDLPSLPHWFLNSATPITPNGFSANGDTVIFVQDWPLIDKNGQSQITFSSPPTMSFEIRPTCERNDTVRALFDFGFTDQVYVNDPLYEVHIDWPQAWHDDGGYLPANMIWYDYLPNLVVNTGLATIDGYENTVQWDLTICNQVDAQHPTISNAEGVWVDIDNLVNNDGNIIITSVQQIGGGAAPTVTDYNGGASTFVEINATINKNTCKTYRIEATYTNCVADDIDSIRVLTGWNCGGFPNPEDAETASCQVDTNYFMIRYKTANLQMAINEPDGAYEVCDTLQYEITLTSSEPANMYDVDLWTNLPDGVQIVDAEYQYPETSSTWTSLPTGSTAYNGYNPFGWDLSAIVPQFSDGFVGSRFPNENEIRIRFGVIMDCDFNPAQDFRILADGITNCNDTVELNAQYFLPIVGFENLVDYEVTHSVSDTLDCSETNIISYTINNQDNIANTTGDTLRVELPGGFSFVPGTGTPSQPTVSGSTLLWPVGSIAANGSKTFTFQIESTTIFDCTPISIPADVYHSVSSSCDVDCDPTALWRDTANTIYCCDPCNVNADFSADTVCVDDETCFDVTDNTMIGSGFTHQWNFGDGNFSNIDEPCHTYADAGTYNVTHIVVDSTGCSDTLTLAVVVSEEPEGSIELLGCNPFCVGDTVYLTVNGTYESIEWVYVNSGTVIGTQDTIPVTQGGVYTAVLYNGACSDSCLSITLSPQPLPVIDIPDTVVCSPTDVVTLDAGAGYTMYNWSTGDTTQTITVGAGTYWVEVGEKLPFGCCTCKAIDTVVVNLNNIDVALNDTTICSGDSVLISPVVSGGTPDYTYQWNTGETSGSIYATNSGTYSVVVTDAIGCQDSASMELTLGTALSAEFSYADSICANDTVCFVASNPGVDSWSISDGFTELVSFGDTNTICFVFNSSGTYFVTHILESECGRDTVTHSVYVNGIDLDLNDTLVCTSADSITLDAGNGYDTYLWNTGETTQTITAGNGTYWVEVGQMFGSTLCTAIDTINVGLSDLAVDITDDTTVCAGGTFRLHSTVTGGVPGYTYQWSTGDVTNYADVFEGGTYSLTVTDALGCQATDSMTLTMIYPVSATFTFDDTICVLDTACFVAESVNGIDEWSIYDQNGNFIAGFGDTSEICFQFPNPGNYTVVHTIENECFQNTYTGNITVVEPIHACIEMIGTNPFCAGDTVLLTIHDPFNQVQAIEWYRDSVFIGSFDTLVVTQPGIYTAEVEDVNGCTEACMCIVLTQLPNPQVPLIDTVYVCGGGDTETIIAGGNFTSYFWTFNGLIVGQSASLTVSTPGVYHLEATNTNGCIAHDSVVVIERPLDVTLTRSVAAACIGENVTLTATNDPNYTYQWQRFFVGSWQNLPGSGYQITTPVYKLGNNSFRVIVTDQVTGCQDIANISVMGIVGPCNSLLVAPNPTTNDRSTVYYSLDGRGIQKATVEVLNMQGQLMQSYTLDTEETSHELNFTGYAEGVYMIRLICDGEVMYADKIVVIN